MDVCHLFPQTRLRNSNRNEIPRSSSIMNEPNNLSPQAIRILFTYSVKKNYANGETLTSNLSNFQLCFPLSCLLINTHSSLIVRFNHPILRITHNNHGF
ncbi:hypothetical protein Hanom_Chr13g01204081 [Helianthus anomalus]